MSDHAPIVSVAIEPTLLENPTLEGEFTGIDLGDKRRDRRACAANYQFEPRCQK